MRSSSISELTRRKRVCSVLVHGVTIRVDALLSYNNNIDMKMFVRGISVNHGEQATSLLPTRITLAVSTSTLQNLQSSPSSLPLTICLAFYLSRFNQTILRLVCNSRASDELLTTTLS